MEREVCKFSPNVPAQIALEFADGKVIANGSVMFSLTDGRVMFLDPDTAGKLRRMELQPGEPFFVCLRWNGERKQPKRWDVWLTPEAEKQRAAEEAPELERQLRESIELVNQQRAGAGMGATPALATASSPSAAYGLAGHHTSPVNGKAASDASTPIAALRTASSWTAGADVHNRNITRERIPVDVVLREILRMTLGALKDSGEQWNDAAKQDLVSTLFITADRAGVIAWRLPGGLQC